MLVGRGVGEQKAEFGGSKGRLSNPADWTVVSHERVAMQSETAETILAELVAAKERCKVDDGSVSTSGRIT